VLFKTSQKIKNQFDEETEVDIEFCASFLFPKRWLLK